MRALGSRCGITRPVGVDTDAACCSSAAARSNGSSSVSRSAMARTLHIIQRAASSDVFTIESEPFMDDFHGNARGLKRAQKEDKQEAVYQAARGCRSWDQVVRIAQEREEGLKGREFRLSVLLLSQMSKVAGPRTPAERQVMRETASMLLAIVKKNLDRLKPFAVKDVVVACGLLGVGTPELTGQLVVAYCNHLALAPLNAHATAELLYAALVLLDFKFEDLPPVHDPDVAPPLTSLLTSLDRKLKYLDPSNLANLLLALDTLPPETLPSSLLKDLEFTTKEVMEQLPLESVAAFLRMRSMSDTAHPPSYRWLEQFNTAFVQDTSKTLPSQVPVLLECLVMMMQQLSTQQAAQVSELAVRYAWDEPRYTADQMLSLLTSLSTLSVGEPQFTDASQQLLAALHDASEGFSTLTPLQTALAARSLASLNSPLPPDTLDDFLTSLAARLAKIPPAGLAAVATNLAALQQLNETVAKHEKLRQKLSRRLEKLAGKLTARQMSLLCSSLAACKMKLTQSCCRALAEGVRRRAGQGQYPEGGELVVENVEDLVEIGGDAEVMWQLFYSEEGMVKVGGALRRSAVLEGLMVKA